MFQPTNGILKFSILDTHLNGRNRSNSTRMSTSDAWLATITAGPFHGSRSRRVTLSRHSGFSATKNTAHAHE
jgi:hypothetical protein